MRSLEASQLCFGSRLLAGFLMLLLRRVGVDLGDGEKEVVIDAPWRPGRRLGAGEGEKRGRKRRGCGWRGQAQDNVLRIALIPVLDKNNRRIARDLHVGDANVLCPGDEVEHLADVVVDTARSDGGGGAFGARDS